jgi:hypothetical protein
MIFRSGGFVDAGPEFLIAPDSIPSVIGTMQSLVLTDLVNSLDRSILIDIILLFDGNLNGI